MLVDNDRAFLRIATTLLESHLTDQVDIVGTASSGEDCLVQAQKLAPDVVLMDLQMPGMGGLRTIPLLRILFPLTRVIALTFDDGERARQAVLEAGGNDLVSKSSLKTDLIPAIQRTLGKSRLRLGAAVS
jgi:two-component system invasion response regulator UvrY